MEPIISGRIVAERVFHDAQASERLQFFSHDVQRFCFDDDTYLNHASWIRPAFQHLAGSAGFFGKEILDYGCGHGMAAVVLARHGAKVTAIDLSAGYVSEAKQRAVHNRVPVRCLVADAEALPFDANSFDGIWGNAILHHLDIARAASELIRVLKPGGVAVFAEPWNGNPLIRFARSYLPYPGKNRTADELPLTAKQLIELRQVFPKIHCFGYDFLSMITRAVKRRSQWLERCDQVLLKACPRLNFWSRYLVLVIQKN